PQPEQHPSRLRAFPPPRLPCFRPDGGLRAALRLRSDSVRSGQAPRSAPHGVRSGRRFVSPWVPSPPWRPCQQLADYANSSANGVPSKQSSPRPIVAIAAFIRPLRPSAPSASATRRALGVAVGD